MPEPAPAEITAALDATADRRRGFGDRLYFFSETASTNDVAASLAEHGAPHGATVVAYTQTAGRGRMGRGWFSPHGAGLYVSVICRESKAAPLLTLAGGVAVAEGTRAATGLPVQLKWPNDVVVETGTRPARRKLAGILAEASTGAEGIEYVVLGMGVNVREAAYPPELAGIATSIETELGRRVDPGAVLAEILAALGARVSQLSAGETQPLLASWRALAPSAIGATVEWTASGETARGTTAGLADDGALLVRTPGGVERVISGELRWI
jgi:BirA family biotin operon repressor/biotin-[acetyl-CoA-carboxylase] ligase